MLKGNRADAYNGVALATIASQWLRLGCTGFGGPPTHITLLRRVCVDQRHWLDAKDFEDGIAATNLLPGPASTQLAWVAFKVGALSYGGGFVIVPLMQHDAVSTYDWMTGPQVLDSVALGQITPGPVVLTVAVVGYSAAGIGGGLLAGLVAFAPSFILVLAGGPRFDQIRTNASIQAILTGAGPAVIGAIAGSTIPLGLAFQAPWQIPILVCALVWLFVVRRGVVSILVLAGAAGVVVAIAGVPV